nr:uncharacterized protein LOC117686264 [Crassostrea gigas]
MEMHVKVTVYVSLFVVWSFNEYACFENLALGKVANQSSFYSNSWDAARAVDGDTRQELFSSSSCAKTGVGQKTASWYVDLGKIMSIHHVDIYYRKESDSAYESTYRKFFAGFSLYISNSTNPNNESLCYHRLQNGTNSPPSVMSIQCEMVGRYVTIYNERLPEQTYPEYYSSTAELELCEVEVYGCQGISQYGEYCLSCPSTCPDARCNMSTGSCFYCLDGFTGENCTESMSYQSHHKNYMQFANCKDKFMKYFRI